MLSLFTYFHYFGIRVMSGGSMALTPHPELVR